MGSCVARTPVTTCRRGMRTARRGCVASHSEPRRAWRGEQGAREAQLDVAALGRRELATLSIVSAAATVVGGVPPALAESFSYDGTKRSAGGPQAVSMTKFVDEEVGYSIDLPQGWVIEIPGGKKEFHAPGDYGGRRVIIETELLGKLKTPSLESLYSLDDYAAQVVDKVGPQAGQGATADILTIGNRENGRYYYYEYRLNSFEPQHVWGVAGVGLGQNESARKFKLRQLVTVTCKMPEKEIKERADEDLLRQVAESFTFVDPVE